MAPSPGHARGDPRRRTRQRVGPDRSAGRRGRRLRRRHRVPAGPHRTWPVLRARREGHHQRLPGRLGTDRPALHRPRPTTGTALPRHPDQPRRARDHRGPRPVAAGHLAPRFPQEHPPRPALLRRPPRRAPRWDHRRHRRTARRRLPHPRRARPDPRRPGQPALPAACRAVARPRPPRRPRHRPRIDHATRRRPQPSHRRRPRRCGGRPRRPLGQLPRRARPTRPARDLPRRRGRAGARASCSPTRRAPTRGPAPRPRRPPLHRPAPHRRRAPRRRPRPPGRRSADAVPTRASRWADLTVGSAGRTAASCSAQEPGTGDSPTDGRAPPWATSGWP